MKSSKFVMLVALCALIVAQIGVSAHATAQTCTPVKKSVERGLSTHTLKISGMDRHYLIYIPEGYDGAEQVPLVLSLHGLASSAAQQVIVTRWNALADSEKFVTVFPQGAFFPARWNAGKTEFINLTQTDDIKFLRELIADVSDKVCIDSDRIYINGLSNGGGMTNRAACEMADVFAAAGSVAGAYSPVPDGCQPARPVPFIAFHGTSDTIVRYYGTPGMQLPPIEQWAGEWAERNGCKAEPEHLAAQGDASAIRYKDCTANAEVVLYTISGGGHTWPGSKAFEGLAFLGKSSADIEATALMWVFFKAHPMKNEQ